MIFPFSACGLSFEIHGDRVFEQAIRRVVEPFESVGPGRYRLLIDHVPGGRYVEQGRIKDLPFDERRDLLEWKGRDGRTARLDVRVVDPEAVSAAIGYLLAGALSENRGLLMHAAVILRDGEMHVFAGESGAGKSTLARNATAVELVHEDKVAVRLEDGRWWAYGLPMLDNDSRPGRNRRASLASVCFIEMGDTLVKRPMSRIEALGALPAHVILPDVEGFDRRTAFESAMELVSDVDAFRVRFGKSSDVGCVM